MLLTIEWLSLLLKPKHFSGAGLRLPVFFSIVDEVFLVTIAVLSVEAVSRVSVAVDIMKKKNVRVGVINSVVND